MLTGSSCLHVAGSTRSVKLAAQMLTRLSKAQILNTVNICRQHKKRKLAEMHCSQDIRCIQRVFTHSETLSNADSLMLLTCAGGTRSASWRRCSTSREAGSSRPATAPGEASPAGAPSFQVCLNNVFCSVIPARPAICNRKVNAQSCCETQTWHHLFAA